MLPNDREWLEIVVQKRISRIRTGNEVTLRMLQRSIEMIASAEALLAAPVPQIWPKVWPNSEARSESGSETELLPSNPGAGTPLRRLHSSAHDNDR
ncbi:hypothetical protein ACVWY3_000453 [Bradyrhizobium sp. USDA 4486]